MAAVQMAVDQDTYAARENFWSAVEEPLARAAENGADLVVFPEYLGVFYPLIPYQRDLDEVGDFLTALEVLSQGAGRPLSLHELFMRGGAMVEEALGRWSALAESYGVTVVAGTFFVPMNKGDGTTELRNRGYVFSPAGELLYHQDKVFLTDFERNFCGLSPGGMAEAVGFSLEGRRILFTICRDTYSPLWAGWYEGRGDIWIDIKANGEVFDQVQEASFRRALPRRLEETTIPYGATVCLVGTYLDLLWQGRSGFLENRSDGVASLMEARSAERGDLIFWEIP